MKCNKYNVLIFSVFIFIYGFTVNVNAQAWTNLLTHKNFVFTPVTGDFVKQWINMSINLATWNESDIGFGISKTDPSGFTWSPALWYKDTISPNKNVHTQLYIQGLPGLVTYYYAGRAKALATDAWTYANSNVWSNSTTFAPNYTITINSLPVPEPKNCKAVSGSPTQVTLSWKHDTVYKEVMIVYKEGSDMTNDPVQGVEYSVNAIIGGGKVLYKGSLNSFLQPGLKPQTNYYYRFYTVNNNYYSSADVTTKKNITTISTASCKFNVNAGKDTVICGFGSVILNPKLSISPFTDSLKIVYDASKGMGILKGAAKVYMHSGIELRKNGGWKYSVGNWGKDDGVGEMKNIGTNLWQITIKPQAYYGFSADSSLYGIFMVFRNQDTLQGRDSTHNNMPYTNMTLNPPVSTFDGVKVSWLKSKYNFIVWSNGSSAPTMTVNSTGRYSVLVTDINGCEGRDTVNVTVAPIPVVKLGNDTAICSGNTVILNAGKNFKSYLWSDGSKNSILTVTKTNVYAVTVTDFNGCKGFDFVKVTVNPNPVVNLGKDLFICQGDSVLLDAGNSSVYYHWSKDNLRLNDSIESLAVKQTGKYSVTVTNKYGCSATASVNVSVNANPVVTLIKDTAICLGTTISLDAGNGYKNYIWALNNKPLSNNSELLIVSNPGKYSVTVTNRFGCSGYLPSVNISNIALAGIHYYLKTLLFVMETVSFFMPAVVLRLIIGQTTLLTVLLQ